MTEKRTCPRCNTAYVPDPGAPGACPRCLMEIGLGEDGGAPPELTAALPDYEIGAELGRGGMGVVYRATQASLDRVVALKVLPPDAIRDPSFPERFRREALALASLNHPGITAVYDFGEAAGHYWFAMEFVDGVDLRQLQQDGRVSPAQALDLVDQICAALQFAHQQGVVHRDIKPENILVDRNGRVKITDFGLAKMLQPDAAAPGLTHSSQVMGTMHYMAPEQMERPAEVDHRADIYSLGVVLYEMLTGELPIGRFPPPSRRVVVDVRLDEVVLRTLEKDPERRYQTAGDVQTDVGRIRQETPRRWPQRSHVRSTAMLAGMAIVALAFTGLLWLAFGGWPVQPMPLLKIWEDGETVSFLEDVEQRLQEHGIGKPAIRTAAGVLTKAFERYRRAELAHSEVSLQGDVVHASIEPFQVEHDALVTQLDSQLESVLGSQYPLKLDVIVRQLFHSGRGYTELKVREEKQNLKWTCTTTEGPAGLNTEDVARRFWRCSYLPPASVLPAARLVLDEIAAGRVVGTTIRVNGLAAAPVHETPATKKVHLDLTLMRDKVAGAVVAYDGLRRQILARPWCRGVQLREHKEETDGRVYHVECDVLVQQPRPDRMLGKDLPARGADPAVAVRQLAATKFKMENVEVPEWVPRPGTTYEAASYQVKAGKQTGSFSRSQLLAFLAALEELGPFHRVTVFRLWRSARGGAAASEDRWTFECYLDVAHRR